MIVARLRTLGFASPIVAALLSALLASPAAAGPLRGYDDSFVDAIFAVLQEIDSATGGVSVPAEHAGCASSPPNTVFSVAFTSGLDYVGGTLYGLEWDGGSGPDIYLYTMAASGCAIGTRLGVTPVGFTNLEALAYNADDEFLYSVDFDFSTHKGSLIRIDPTTGVGSAVGSPMAFDLRVVGLAWDPLTGVLYGVTSVWGGGASRLVTIDTATGVAVVVGATGIAAGGVESLAFDLSGPAPLLRAAGTTLYAIDEASGAATVLGESFNGEVWAMAARHAVVFADGFETSNWSRWSYPP